MTTRIRTFVFALLLLAALLMSALYLLRSPRQMAPPLTLPDGTRLHLRAVTYGTNHAAPGAALTRWLPAKPRSWIETRVPALRPIFTSHSFPAPNLVLWLEVEAGPNQLTPPATTAIVLADHLGQPAGQDQSIVFSRTPARSGQVIAFPAAPCRSRTVIVRWIEGTSDEPFVLAEWPIPNKAFTDSADTSATTDTLPVARTSGDLTLTLERLVAGLDASVHKTLPGGIELQPAGRAGAEVSATLVATLEINGQRRTDWGISSVALSDMAGHCLTSGSMSQGPMHERLWVTWQPVLWPSEPWKMQIELKRSSHAAFADNEVIEFRNLELNDSGTTQFEDKQSTNGVTVQLQSLTLRVADQRRTSYSMRDYSTLKVRAWGLAKHQFVDLLGVVDDSGHTHTSGSHSSSSTGGTIEREYSFRDLTNRLLRASVRFAVHRSHQFDFVVQPETIRSNTLLAVPKIEQ